MIQYAGFTQRQVDYLRNAQSAWLNCAEGGKRAGKNIINLLSWAMVLEDHPDRLHLAAGVSQSAVMMNIIDSDGFGLKWIFAGRCHEGQYNGRNALIIRDRHGEEKAILIAGGGDARSASLIKGFSLGTAYITEVNECHQTFFQEVVDRTLASGKRQLFFDLNPKPPSHWFYSEFLNYQDELKRQGKNNGYNYGHFTIADNKSLSIATIKQELTKYDKTSIWYQRDILGKRTSASGRIYTSYNYSDVQIPAKNVQKLIEENDIAEWSVGVDVGGTDATVATLTAFTKGYKDVIHVDGIYNKQGIDNKIDDALYIAMVCDWLEVWNKVIHQPVNVYYDSAAKLFGIGLKNELYRRGMTRYKVVAFDKTDGINNRIQLSSMLMVQGRYKIAEHLKKWHEAYQMATWTEKGYEKGEWIRTDDGSYPVDCLDSAEYSFYAYKRYLIK